ncbi:MAG: outer membrane lipoprotein-sorting protein [Myxococcota bacterium]|nr:outer membrane lipoprotein-sorting protein [Myxococcota bacterium]
MTQILPVLLLFTPAVVATAASLDPAPPPGIEIVEKVNARDDGETLVQSIAMTLTDKRGRVRTREIRTYRRRVGPDRQSLVAFESPRSLRGTAFLTFDYPEGEDDQWLYLPAARKSRRISAADRGRYFMGTDLTYEDIKNENRINASDYRFETVGIENVSDRPCWRVSAKPRSDDLARALGYGRLELLVDREQYVVRRFDSWDIGGNPLKQVRFEDFRSVDGILTPHRIEATNHKSGHQTRLQSHEVQYRTEIDEEIFSPWAMNRAR